MAPQLELPTPDIDERPAVDGVDLGVLARAAALRFPDLRDLFPGARIEKLVEHINDTAVIRGELEELRLEAHLRLREARAELSRIPTGVTRNRAAIDEAKRQVRPDLASAIADAEWVIARCTEQLHRFGGSDYDAASRIYTMLS